MLDDVLTDELWRRVRYLGRRPVDDRAALAGIGIVCVLRTGVAWPDLPTTVGCSGVTCWRRLADWQAAGVWPAVPATLLAELAAAGRCDLPAALVDAAHLHALTGGSRSARPRPTGPIPAASTI